MLNGLSAQYVSDSELSDPCQHGWIWAVLPELSLLACSRICQNSGHRGKSILNSALLNAVFKFNLLARGGAITLGIWVVPRVLTDP